MKFLEHDFGDAFTIRLGVHGALSQENWLFTWLNAQHVIEYVMPEFLHGVPVGDDAELDGVNIFELTTFGFGFIPKDNIFRINLNEELDGMQERLN